MNSQRSKWDFSRFVNTLSYFEAIPVLGCIKRLQNLFGRRSESKLNGAEVMSMGVILVAGATGGVGKRVVRCLTEQGYQVRSIVRDAARAKTMLGDSADLIEADITLPETLTAAVMQGVSAVICCTGTRVQPVEGDTPSREKYYQGIKFYMPEVVDVPEVVEYEGIRNLVEVVKPSVGSIGFDFTQPSANLQGIWGALDDVVMGGVSESSIRLSEAAAVFSGNVSTANSGGFASIRTRNFEPTLNLGRYDGVELRVRGDGNRYKFMLRSEDRWDGVAYCHSFDTIAHSWLTVRIPFTDLVPVFRAKTIQAAGAIDSSQIRAFQLMLSKFEYDGALNPHFTPGSFQLEVESIKVYSNQTLPQFVMISSAGVTRPGRPGLNLEEEPPAVRMNDQLGGILTWKLRGEDYLRQSGIPYTIIRPCALTESAGGQNLVFEQGDHLKGKVSREDIAQLCVAALKIPQACNVTIEVAEGQGGCAVGDWTCLFSPVQSDLSA
jgi:uncharacterized protein YbjT (DUF2867 family)